MTQRTIIVGDVHGMLPELDDLFIEVGFRKGIDRLVSVGDLIHKGPDSAGVVRRMRERGAILVLGNHEDQQARYRVAAASASHPSKVKMKNTEELYAVENSLSTEDVDFLESARPFLKLPEHDALVVHGGVLPVQETLPTEEELAGMSKGDLKKLYLMCRTRYVTGKAVAKVTVEYTLEGSAAEAGDLALRDMPGLATSEVETRRSVRPAGSFISLGQETEDDPFWADVYDGRFGHIYFGHSPYLDTDTPVEFSYATGLDLGAVFGGHLAAAILEVGKEPRFVSVRASGKFARSFWED